MYILGDVTKRLIDVDDQLLAAAKAHFHTTTIKDTINAALAESAARHEREVEAAFDTLAGIDFTDDDREDAWKR
jgi:Arc/MetJ family transcription regulator